MFHISLLLSIALFFMAGPAEAHPPQKIIPQYDKKNETLLLEIKHLSQDKFDHYIEKITVVKNDASPIKKTQRIQPHPNSLYADIPLFLEEGDVVKITAESTEGGHKDLEWVITEEILEAELIPKKEYSQAAPVIPKDKSRLKPAVPRNSEVSKSPHPDNSDAYKPAFTRDPGVAKPTHPKDPSKYKPAFTLNADVAKPAVPTENTKTQPATPNTRTIQKQQRKYGY